MNKITIYRISLFATIALTVIGILLNSFSSPIGFWLVKLGIVCSLGFIIPGLKDVLHNRRNTTNVKIMWIIGLLFFSWLAGLLYFRTFKRNKRR